MRIIYNLAQILLAPLVLIILPFYLFSRPEKLQIIISRLGFNLNLPQTETSPTIWVHALSVGEVTSALPLIKQIRKQKQDSVTLIFSATTKSGYRLAEDLLHPYVDALNYYPLDILPSVLLFIKKFKPDLFILVETDFWPNFLMSLGSRKIPSLLVNGRISDTSISTYRRFKFFFKPIFNQFRCLCMQSDLDAEKMYGLGIPREKIKVLGNLKFAGISDNTIEKGPEKSPFPSGALVILCGSTHEGEESIIIETYQELRKKYTNLHLAIAPRDIGRSNQIARQAEDSDAAASRYSEASSTSGDITIIDTIGDLSALYAFSDISFIGGSLVAAGGHNPIEAARSGCPILFGPHMEDFLEIRTELLAEQAALEVMDQISLTTTLESLIRSEDMRQSFGLNAKNYATAHSEVINAHMRIITQYL